MLALPAISVARLRLCSPENEGKSSRSIKSGPRDVTPLPSRGPDKDIGRTACRFHAGSIRHPLSNNHGVRIFEASLGKKRSGYYSIDVCHFEGAMRT